jgi:hypothetical protein
MSRQRFLSTANDKELAGSSTRELPATGMPNYCSFFEATLKKHGRMRRPRVCATEVMKG